MNTSCITINCGCCDNEKPVNVLGDMPVGTIISYMGTKAPEHYLICDGSELNIHDYQSLSEQIFKEFGVVNYFGGDGANTFAIPDLRDEFLRGYHGANEEKLSEEIGMHQNPTAIPTFAVMADKTGSICYPGEIPNVDVNPVDTDKQSEILYANRYAAGTYGTENLGAGRKGIGATYTTRPTNTTVLFCIRYE